MQLSPQLYLVAEGESQLLTFLETLVLANKHWLLTHPGAPHIYDAGVVYRRETGREEWLSYPVLLARGEGDCEDLAAALAGWLRARDGIEAKVVLRKYTSGKRVWYHALVKLPGGRLKDPSKKLGM